MALPTACILIQASAVTNLSDQGAAVRGEVHAVIVAALGLSISSQRIVWSPVLTRTYLYAHLPRRTLLTAAAVQELNNALSRGIKGLTDLRASRLEKVFDVAGASAPLAAGFHYVVEMDPEPGWKTQLFEWYNEEHMPGLAAVPGCVHASRYLNHDHGPLSLACYDLVRDDIKGSPPWMAISNTEWSSRMRPHFTNTVRTMFKLCQT